MRTIIFLYAAGGSSGPELKNGSAVTAAEYSGWTPIGAVQTSSGYDIAWKDAATGQYSFWTTDSSGNLITASAAMPATSSAVESYETVFHQDLNGDGVIGLSAAPNTTLRVSNTLAGTSGSATIGARGTLELAAANSASVTFAHSTGMLKLIAPPHSAARSSTLKEMELLPVQTKLT